MAQLALATAGAVGGGQLFGTIGAQAGFLAGSFLGAWLFAPSTTSEGPRLDNLRVSTSTYGEPIPIGFGTSRFPGNCIWATDIQETKNEREVGGKGGPSATQITYTYSCSFAIAFAQREATHFLRIWADSKLIYDVTGETQSNKGFTIRFYYGTEAQDVDPLIESEEGVGNTPAYKGLTYLVFEDMPLEDFGNRIPSITAEIAFNGSDSYPKTNVTPAEANSNFPNQDSFVADPARPYLWLVYRDNLAKINRYSGDDEGGRTLPDTNLGGLSTVGADGALFVQCGVSNAAPVYKFDPSSLELIAGIGPISGGRGSLRHLGNKGFMKSATMPQLSSDNPDVVVHLDGTYGDRIKVFSQNDITLLLDLTSAERAAVENPEAVPELVYHGAVLFDEIGEYNGGVGAGFDFDRDGNIWVITENKQLIKINITASTDPGNYGTESESTLFYSAKVFDLSSDALYSGNFITYNEDDHSLLIGTYLSTLSTDNTALISFDIASESVTTRYTVSTSIDGPGTHSKGNFSYGVQNGKIFLGNGQQGNILNATSLERLSIHTWTDYHSRDERGYFWDEPSNSVFYNTDGASTREVWRYWLSRAAGAAEGLDSVVEFLCNRAQLTDSMINVTDLAGYSVSGYQILQQSTGKNSLAPLSSAYFFDAVESDWTIKFIRAGRSGDFAIPNADLAAHLGENRPPELTESVSQEIELPRHVYVKYMDKASNYQPGEAVAARRGDTVRTRRRKELNFPIVLTGSQAKEIAYTWLYRLWNAQTNLTFNLSQKWLLLDPTDTGTITKDSTVFTAQITDTSFGDFVLDISALQEDSETYSQDLGGDSGRDQSSGDIPNYGQTTPLFFDTTLLRDQDSLISGAGIRAYGAVIAYTDDWRGAGYFKSTDGNDFNDILFFASGERVEYGNLTSDLAESDGWATWDRFRFFRVKMAEGAPESATETNVLNGANAALIGNPTDGWEVIQYATVTDEGNGTYKIEDLLRARRGTNNFQTHRIGDLFVILSESTIKRMILDLDALSNTRYFAATSIGAVFDSNKAISRVINGNALKPWSPADVRAVWDSPSSNDITVTWERRTRYGGSWLNGTGSVPLNEDSESYEADIIDTNGDVIRTFDDLTSETFTYTAAQQTTDFGSTQTEIRVKLYQISEIAGRGFVADKTMSEG